MGTPLDEFLKAYRYKDKGFNDANFVRANAEAIFAGK